MDQCMEVEDAPAGNCDSSSSSSSSYNIPAYPTLPVVDLEEWKYVMRRTMQEVIPGLFLGPYAVATKSKLDELKIAGITHIVCVREAREKNLIKPNHPDDFTYLTVEIEDSNTANIIPLFRVVNPFIRNALTSGGRVLVHGSAGISRSVTLVISFIMETFGVTTHEAHKYVQAIRFCSNPNEGFMAQLREYEPIYRAMHAVPVPLPFPTQRFSSNKRSLEMDEDEEEEGRIRGGKH